MGKGTSALPQASRGRHTRARGVVDKQSKARECDQLTQSECGGSVSVRSHNKDKAKDKKACKFYNLTIELMDKQGKAGERDQPTQSERGGSVSVQVILSVRVLRILFPCKV